MTSPEHIQPYSMELIQHVLHEFAQESQEYVLINARRRAAENILAHTNNADATNRAIDTLASMPPMDVIEAARIRSHAAEQQARADLQLPEDISIDALGKIVSYMHWSGHTEDTPVYLDGLMLPPITETFTVLRGLARLRGRSYAVEANMFGTTHVDISPDSDVGALLEQGYQQDIETLSFYQSNPSQDYTGVAQKTVADIDAYYGKMASSDRPEI